MFTSSRELAGWDRAGGCGKEGRDGDLLQLALAISFRLPLALRIFATPAYKCNSLGIKKKSTWKPKKKPTSVLLLNFESAAVWFPC